MPALEASRRARRASAGAPPRPARGPARIIAALIVAFAAVAIAGCAIKWRYYLYIGGDLAIFTQALAGLMRGTMFGSIRDMNWLGDHASLAMFLIAPLYALFRHPMTLLVVQSVALALGA